MSEEQKPGYAYVAVKFSELCEMLRLPKGSKVIGVERSPSQPFIIGVLVEHPDLHKPYSEGEVLPYVRVDRNPIWNWS